MVWRLKENHEVYECLCAALMGQFEVVKLVDICDSPDLERIKNQLFCEVERVFQNVYVPDVSNGAILKKRLTGLLDELAALSRKIDCPINIDPGFLVKNNFAVFVYWQGLRIIKNLDEVRERSIMACYAKNIDALRQRTIELVSKVETSQLDEVATELVEVSAEARGLYESVCLQAIFGWEELD